MRSGAVLVAVGMAGALLFANPAVVTAQGDQRSAIDWLQNEPVSLLDWGMLRLQRDLERATDHVARTYLRTSAVRHGVYFRFFDRRVVAYVTLADVPRNRTEDACRDVYLRIRDRMTSGAPQGAGGAGWYLESVFGHDSRRGDRPNDLGAQLLDRVVFQVAIGPEPEAAAHGDIRKVLCFGRFDADSDGIAMRSEG